VTGYSGGGSSALGTAGPAAKESDFTRKPATKIMIGDWIWQPDRPLNLPAAQWHNYKGKRKLNMLFGDLHVGPTPQVPVWEKTTSSQTVNPNYFWW
jgi:prepilin-type processing-associated H-X9-DG protein